MSRNELFLQQQNKYKYKKGKIIPKALQAQRKVKKKLAKHEDGKTKKKLNVAA